MINFASLVIASSFDDIYGTTGVIPTYYNEIYDKKYLGVTDKSQCYICNCVFSNLGSKGSGGALYIRLMDTEVKCLVEFTSFEKCQATNGPGGALYFNSNQGQCALSSVCSKECTIIGTDGSSYYGLFSKIQIKSDKSYQILIDMSSVILSKSDNENVKATYRLDYGFHVLSNINMSHNLCGRSPTIDDGPNGKDGCLSLSFSSFVGNIAIDYTIMDLKLSTLVSVEGSIKSCNIIENDNLNPDTFNQNFAILKAQYTIIIQNSNFVRNNPNQKLLSVKPGKIILKECYVDSLEYNGNVITESMKNEQNDNNFDILMNIICREGEPINKGTITKKFQMIRQIIPYLFMFLVVIE